MFILWALLLLLLLLLQQPHSTSKFREKLSNPVSPSLRISHSRSASVSFSPSARTSPYHPFRFTSFYPFPNRSLSVLTLPRILHLSLSPLHLHLFSPNCCSLLLLLELEPPCILAAEKARAGSSCHAVEAVRRSLSSRMSDWWSPLTVPEALAL